MYVSVKIYEIHLHVKFFFETIIIFTGIFLINIYIFTKIVFLYKLELFLHKLSLFIHNCLYPNIYTLNYTTIMH